MNIVFLVRSPFSYIYQTQKYYAAGDRLKLVKGKDDSELTFLIQNDLTKFLFLDEFNTDSKLVQSVKEALTFKQDFVGTEPFDLVRYKNERGDKAPSSILEVTSVTTPKEIKLDEEMVIRPEKQEEKKEEEKIEVEVWSQEYLDSLPWRKVRKITEQNGIDYTNKDEAIEALLKLKKTV